MYSSPNYVQNAQLQPNMYIQGESNGALYNTQIPTNHFLTTNNITTNIHTKCINMC